VWRFGPGQYWAYFSSPSPVLDVNYNIVLTGVATLTQQNSNNQNQFWQDTTAYFSIAHFEGATAGTPADTVDFSAVVYR
jgi:hypothetical protein